MGLYVGLAKIDRAYQMMVSDLPDIAGACDPHPSMQEFQSPVTLGSAINAYAQIAGDLVHLETMVNVSTTKVVARFRLGQFLGHWHQRHPEQAFSLEVAPGRMALDFAELDQQPPEPDALEQQWNRDR